ncbi:MAG TPA: LysR family transcriptional regulator [Chakrabartia sp.]|nr:LysR family transcriptional regulator [Chakrabartia sp.]
MMHWDDLRYFLALVRARTLAGAAQKLGVDATTVGRRIERLTAAYGTSLFETGPAGHMMTASGDELLRHAEDVERAILAAGTALTGERSRYAGTVRLSLSEGFATWVIAPHLPAFAESHPDIALEIVTTNGFLNPSKREADLAVMLARPVQGALTAAKLTDYTLGLYASAEYLRRHGPVAELAELRGHRLIGYIPDFIYAEELRYLPEVAEGLDPAYSSSSINVQHALAASGLGIGILPHFIGQQSPPLLPVLANTVRIRRSFWTVVHRDLSRVSRVRAVIDWLHHIAAASGLFADTP